MKFTTKISLLYCLTLFANPLVALGEESLDQAFSQPPDKARPWVYWYFQDGHLTREGMKADLEAMKKAGIGGALYLEVTAMGIPKGPVEFMSPAWQDLIVAAIHDCDRLGLEFSLGTGPGWCGAGGPWIKPDDAMQHLVGKETEVSGPKEIKLALPKPTPRNPFFYGLKFYPELLKEWQEYYRDVAVIAYPTPTTDYRLKDADEKALYYRAPYSSRPGVKAYLPADATVIPAGKGIDPKQVVELSDKLAADGTLSWEVPPGKWTILRLGRTLTGQTTRPAPQPGLGWETGKFEKSPVDAHFKNYLEPLFAKLGKQEHAGHGWNTLHFDSWEMSSQNWSPTFREEFKKRRGYDPLPYLPAMQGNIVESVETTERFLWDLRRTAQELVVENQAGRIKELAAKHDLKFTIEPYDLNPAGDLALGDVADTPACEFWSPGRLNSDFSVFEAVSCAHTRGHNVVQAEAFTSAGDAWRQHPGSMKEQGDWAFCAGVNRFTIHRYSAQPELDKKPGLPWGFYGIHWERTQTWWEMVPAYHLYLTRCQALLQRGLTVSDVLYLDVEGAPNVFRPPTSALLPGYPDRKGYNFDGCSPGTLIERASVKDGRIVFPNGMSYRLLVLPRSETMTPELLRKVKSLVDDGALVMGYLPKRSPSLENQPQSDEEVARLSKELVESKRVLPDEAPEPMKPDSLLVPSKWIWTEEMKPKPNQAPVGTRYFTREINIPQSVATATVTMSAKDSFELSINGQAAGSGNDVHKEWKFDIAPLIKPGKNIISVVVKNAEKGPAGLIGTLELTLSDGKKQRITTDRTWIAGTDASQPLTAAVEIWKSDQGPWAELARGPLPPVLYPSYEVTAKILADRGVPPDFFTSGDLRYTHRVDGDTDYYFVGNRKAELQKADVSFRVSGREPFLWDPLTGTERPLPQYSEKDGVTTIPMQFAPKQSFFVVFKPKATQSGAGAASTDAGKNFPEFRPVLSLDKDWMVTFDPKWGGPDKPIAFSALDDWSKRTEEGIKYYSGTALYEKTFDLSSVPAKETKLDLGSVAVMAEVTLNGENLGVAWCPPWQVTIPPGVLQKTGNKLKVKVANLWPNRLIRDYGLPKEQRVAQLTEMNYQFYSPHSPLLPSGLLGPVTIQSTEINK